MHCQDLAAINAITRNNKPQNIKLNFNLNNFVTLNIIIVFKPKYILLYHIDIKI
jgi:hypothetical protein